MKNKITLLISICTIILFGSCDKTETFDDQWKLDNEAQFAKIAVNSEYTKLNSLTGNGFVMYKVLETGSGDRSPYFNEEVKALYTGWLKYDWTKPDSYKDEKDNFVTNKIIFDTTEGSNIPRTFRISSRIDGFSTALQHMNKGDKWEVWIPWKLGYGESGNNDIRGYSTLVFEIELVDIIE